MQLACSDAAFADSLISAKTEPVLCFMAKQRHSSLSFSGLNGENSAGDYQDCGASSMLLMEQSLHGVLHTLRVPSILLTVIMLLTVITLLVFSNKTTNL
jgi:hypothetical protein